MTFSRNMAVCMLLALLAGCAGLPHHEDHKRAVCHKGKTLYVDENAVDAHIRHGDYGRACYGEKKKERDKREHGHEDRDDHDDRD